MLFSSITEKSDNHDLVSIIISTLNEEENIGRLILSVFEQKYRPIEVVVVDGGSRDSTVMIADDLRGKMSNNTFEIKILFEKDFGSLRSSSNARNIGIKNSKGDYVIFFDADFILIDKNLISKVKEGLDQHPWVGVKVIPIIDSWIERNLATSDYSIEYAANVHKYCGVRRKLFRQRMFNPILGFGEDKYFFEHLGMDTMIIDAFVGRHFPHTLSEYKKQRIWYARTLWPYLEMFPSIRNFFELILMPVGSLGLLTFGIIFFEINFVYSLILLLTFIIILMYAFGKSPERSVSRLVYLLFSRSLGSIFYTYGLLRGFIEVYLKHRIFSSRD